MEGRKFGGALAVVVAVLALGAAPAGATFPGKPGLIANGTADGLHLFKPDGSHDRIVSADLDVVDPSWSADGTKIVFGGRGGSSGGPFHIYVLTVKRGSLRQVTFAPQSDYAPSFSPNGRSIIFIRDMPHDDAAFRARATGGHLRQVAEGPRLYDAEYAPDGTTFAVVTGGGSVYLGDPTHEYLHEIAHFAIGNGTQLPSSVSWAPNSRRLAIGTTANGECDQCGEIWTVKRSGANLHRVSGPSAGYGRPFYRPHGGEIAFCFSQYQAPVYNLVSELRMMNQDGSHTRTLGPLCGSDWQPLPK